MSKKSIKTDYLVDYIIKNIERGDYIEQRFPSERALSRETGMSLTTVRKAVELSLERGYLAKDEKTHRISVHPDHEKPPFSAMISMILPHHSAHSYLPWHSALTDVCRNRNYRLQDISYRDRDDKKLLGALSSHSADLIFIVPPSDPGKILLDRMKKCSNYLVSLFVDLTKHGISSINPIPICGVKKLLEHLSEKGHRQIDCFNVENESSGVAACISAWKDFLSETSCTGELLQRPELHEGSQQKIARALIHEYIEGHGKLPHAFLCTTAMAAIGLSRGLSDFGIRPGIDISICAFGPQKILKYMTPSITSIATPPKEDTIEMAFELHAASRLGRGVHIEPDDVSLFIGESTDTTISKTRAFSR